MSLLVPALGGDNELVFLRKYLTENMNKKHRYKATGFYVGMESLETQEETSAVG
jgi:hypothetical protein